MSITETFSESTPHHQHLVIITKEEKKEKGSLHHLRSFRLCAVTYFGKLCTTPRDYQKRLQ